MVTVNDPLGPSLVTVPTTTVTKTGDAYSTETREGASIMMSVTIGTGHKQVQLPNGLAFDDGETVLLTVSEFDRLAPGVFGGGTPLLVNNGPVELSSLVGDQGLAVSAIATIAVTITDAAMSLASDTTEQATAAGTLDNGGIEDVTNHPDVIWKSSDPTKATVSASGLITALATGTTDITAQVGDEISAPVTVTVAA